jgi:glycerophosphoryl diester phosphodiesterase
MSDILNYAHRGFTKNFPDNTLEAFEAAIKIGADGIECDVHETSDSHFIIYHDDDIKGKAISEMTLAEVREVRLKGGYKIPTLEETLDVCRKKIHADLEVKLVYSVDKFLGIVRAGIPLEDVLLTSFYGALITDLADSAPDIKRGILSGFTVRAPIDLMKMTRAQVMLPRFSFTTMALVDRLHNRGLQIIPWDCNSEHDLRSAIEWGVDGIITDNADVLGQELGKRKQA